MAKLKAVSWSGPSGGCIPEALLDNAIDYEDLKATGAIMGSSGMIVADGRPAWWTRPLLPDLRRMSRAGKCIPAAPARARCSIC